MRFGALLLHGLKVTILTPLLGGSSVAFPLSPAVVDVHEWFETLRPSWYSAGPALHLAILEAACAHPEGRGGSGRVSLLPAAPLGQEIIDSFERTLGFLCWNTTAPARPRRSPPTPRARKPGTVRASPGRRP